MLTLLKQAVDANVLSPLDLQLAKMFANDDEPLVILAIAWLSAEVGAGHVCLPIHWLRQENLFNGRQPELAQQIWQKVGNPQPEDWLHALELSEVVGDGAKPTPFILDSEYFYLQRMWLDEGRIASFFNHNHTIVPDNTAEVRRILAHLFDSDDSLDWQKVAAAVAVSQRVAVISGGPGTGKTTTVAKLLAALIKLSDKADLRIVLAAPTGKAAARLTESLAEAVEFLPLTAHQKALIPTNAATIHRLLGIRANSQRLRYHQNNPLHVDVLVVDEASMIDLPMMARLIAALPPHARFILLGDRDQLSSVEAGAVLGDVCRFVETGYSLAKTLQLNELTGYQLTSQSISVGPMVRDSLCLLRKSYRFDAQSGIGQLAQSVNSGDVSAVFDCFAQSFSDIEKRPLVNQSDYQRLIEVCVNGYSQYLTLQSEGTAQQILSQFAQFQLLCALRRGPFGVEGLNESIEQALIRRGLIRKASGAFSSWYAGRPVMINRNDNTLELYNGDIGIALYNEDRELRVYFPRPDGSVRSVQTHRLPECETAFAMTVHKSQGSEFSHTVLALPDVYSPLLTRELLYTAITRARSKLTLFANDTILTQAVDKPTERRSGLAERLR